MPVVALVSEPEANLVRRAIDSGAYFIFTEPLSQASAEHGLKALIMHRRPFVVTYDYVGPDRRRAAREAEETISLVEVPNPLRRWTTGFSDEPPSKKNFNAVNTMRAQRQTVQFLWLADQVIAHLTGGPQDSELKDHLPGMQTVAAETKVLAAVTKCRNQGTLCDLAAASAKSIWAAIKAGSDPDITDLGHLTGLIQAPFEIQDPSDASVDA